MKYIKFFILSLLLGCSPKYANIGWEYFYNKDFKNLLIQDEAYSVKVLNIERGNIKPRKDISAWSEVEGIIKYMFKLEFEKIKYEDYEFQTIKDKNEIKEILKKYIDKYFDINDDKEKWFEKIKDLSEVLGYAREVKEYKQNRKQI